MKIYLKKIGRNIEDYGYWTSIKKVFSYIIAPVYLKRSLILYEIDINKGDERSLNDNYQFKMIQASDRKIIDIIEGKEEWLKGELSERISSSCCMAILHKKKVIGFYLASFQFGHLPLLKLKIRLEKNEAWGEQITIFKDYRRMGLGSKLRSTVYSELRKIGIKHLYGHRAGYNIASQKSAKKYLLKEFLIIEYIKMFGYHKLRLDNISFEDKDNRKMKKDKITVRTNAKNKYLFELVLKKIIMKS